MTKRFSSIVIAGVAICLTTVAVGQLVRADDEQATAVAATDLDLPDDLPPDLPGDLPGDLGSTDEDGPTEDLERMVGTEASSAADGPLVLDAPAENEVAKDEVVRSDVAKDEPGRDLPAPQAAVPALPTAPKLPVVVKKPAAAAVAKTPSSAAPAKAPAPVPASPKKPVLLPGTGSLVKGVGDDFEDENWKWNYNHPKSSEEQDKRMRGPMARSINGRWFEGPKRGTPDVVKRIQLPSPGLEGSTHGLLIASLHAGIPGATTYQMQQDDLIYNMQKVTGRGISVADSPSVVTRVYMAPFEQWEKRSGPTFGFRAGCYTHAIITGKDHPDKGRFGLEEYWPGMFVCFEPANAKRKTEDSAYLRIRGGRNGGEIRGPKIDQSGWWTLGLSFTPDGMVHYFASPGVDELTMDDHITSQFPYGYRTELLKTFFYNVCTKDDGKTWSTPWVVDDPKVYFVKRQVAATKGPTRR